MQAPNVPPRPEPSSDARSWMTVVGVVVAAVVGGVLGSAGTRAAGPRAAPEPAPPIALIEAAKAEAEAPPAEPAPAPAPAPAPKLYLARTTALRTQVGGRRGPTLESGTEVHRLTAHQGWVLVLAGPGGPAGFVEADALTTEKPVAALAREREFSGCAPPYGSCMVSARRQRARCEEQCRPEPGSAARRCRAACRLAYEHCTERCR